MEPVTHFLFGACLSRAGLNRRTALATATITLAAEAPDIDVLGEIKGPVFGFAHHRGFTHSFLGIILISGYGWADLCGLALARAQVETSRSPPRWGLLFLFAYIAGVAHILLDFTNNYGVRPFWPFWEKWYSWDIVYIVEPVMLILMVGALVLPSLFSLINEEVGARDKGPKGRLAATVALAGIVVMWGLRDYEHRRALNAMEPIRRSGDAARVGLSLHAESVSLVWGRGDKKLLRTDGRGLTGTEVDPEDRMQIRYKPKKLRSLSRSCRLRSSRSWYRAR